MLTSPHGSYFHHYLDEFPSLGPPSYPVFLLQLAGVCLTVFQLGLSFPPPSPGQAGGPVSWYVHSRYGARLQKDTRVAPCCEERVPRHFPGVLVWQASLQKAGVKVPYWPPPSCRQDCPRGSTFLRRLSTYMYSGSSDVDGHPIPLQLLSSTVQALLHLAGYSGSYTRHSFWIGASTTAAALRLLDSLIRSLGLWFYIVLWNLT